MSTVREEKLSEYRKRAMDLLRTHNHRFEFDDPDLTDVVANAMVSVHEEVLDAIESKTGALVVDPRLPISKEWTLAERSRVVLAMLHLIQSDIYAGRYSVVGRPNITSIQHVFAESAETLEGYRADIENMLDEGEKHRREYLAQTGRLS